MQRFAEMFTDPDSDPRVEIPTRSDERTMLVASLRRQRETLVLKCSGLDPEAMALRSVDFSGLSLLGLVRHLADVEHRWFRQRLAGQDGPAPFATDAEPDGAFDHAAPGAARTAAAWRAWQEEVDFAERFVAEAPDLDVWAIDPWQGRISLRWVLLHMVEEYARHNGHADLLRQGIDGAVGL
ncbi:DinB family protein [Streptomyces sp. NBC_01218]|uniref:DinB family protein n=1 Tax=unclassified Streptomyces TaxID=2593676 RepID=UPI0023B8A67E|nr:MULTISPECIES: DinB family protein [unclassified Streptomyces]WEH42743.1 DinB family protein [Streptomyces sp. AM 2-1-1]WSQ54381.1 DinB family protein [Streptomyces sp. NBC_01218]